MREVLLIKIHLPIIVIMVYNNIIIIVICIHRGVDLIHDIVRDRVIMHACVSSKGSLSSFYAPFTLSLPPSLQLCVSQLARMVHVSLITPVSAQWATLGISVTALTTPGHVTSTLVPTESRVLKWPDPTSALQTAAKIQPCHSVI